MTSRGIRRFVAAAALASTCAFACAAGAQDDDAAALFRQGQEAYANGDTEGAFDKYQQAWELKQSYDIAGNLGNVEVKLEKYAEAVPHLQFVLDNLPVSMDSGTREAVTKRTGELLAEAKSHVAIMKFTITPANAAVEVDGKPVTGQAVVAPGKHSLKLTADGYDTVEQEVNVSAGSTENTVITMAQSGSGDTAKISHGEGGDDGGGEASIPVIIAGGVLGIGAIAAGAALHVVASGKGSDRQTLLDDLGNNSGACTPPAVDARCAEIDDLAAAESTFSGAGTGLLIGGGVIVAATVTYWLWPRGGDDPAPAEEAFQITPVLSPGFVGAIGSF
jgi:PEGA domain